MILSYYGNLKYTRKEVFGRESFCRDFGYKIKCANSVAMEEKMKENGEIPCPLTDNQGMSNTQDHPR
jgi:hypothetical protein